MKRPYLFFAFSVLLIQSCIGQELPNYSLEDVPIVVNIDSVKSVPKEITIFSNVRYVPLETTDDCLIGYTNKVLVENSRIYVADFYHAVLFIFDMKGRFLFKISRMGQGPGEYLSFRDFDIQSNGDIYMLDHYGKKILVFDSSGEYLSEIQMDYHYSYFCLMKDKIYGACLGGGGRKIAELVVYDMEDKRTEFLLKDKKFLLTNERDNYVAYRFFKSPSGITYYSPRFSEIIYHIDERGVHPAIGIKNLRFPPEHIIREWESSSDFGLMTKDYLYFKENTQIYETEKNIAFWCITGVEPFTKYLVYNKNSGSFSAVDFMSFQMILCVDGIKGSTGSGFFSIMSPYLKYEKDRKLLASREDLKDWKEEDNPIIVFFNFDF